MSQVVISQVYGGATNGGYANDFVELHNIADGGSEVLSLSSLQYASGTATSSQTTWSVLPIPTVTIEAGKFYLIQLGTNTGGPLPPPADLVHTGVDLGWTAGKIALMHTQAAATLKCPPNGLLADLVGYGTTANWYETRSAPAPGSQGNSIVRRGGGCQDTNDNWADFVVSPAAPRNSLSNAVYCH